MDLSLPETTDISALQAIVEKHNTICRKIHRASAPGFDGPGLFVPQPAGLITPDAMPDMEARFTQMIQGTGLGMKKKLLGSMPLQGEPAQEKVPGAIQVALGEDKKSLKITGDTLDILMLRDVVERQKRIPAKNGDDENGPCILLGGIHCGALGERLEATLDSFRKARGIEVVETPLQAMQPERPARIHHGVRFDSAQEPPKGQQR